MPDHEYIFPALQERGVEELVVRVSRYDGDEPAAWQAIARFRHAPKGPWGVGVRSNPQAAVEAALFGDRGLTGTVESVCHTDRHEQTTEDPFA